MKTLNTLRTATIATLAMAAVSLPTLAQATDTYRNYDRSADCRAEENDARLIGGILGAVVGGVVGSQVSGNGARTEGSAIGAVVGGLAGAGIGDESVDCDNYRRDAYRDDRNRGINTSIVYRDNGYRPANHRTGNGYGYDNDYNYRNRGQLMKERRRIEKQLRKIEKRQYRVERELKELWYKKRYLSRYEFKHLRAELYGELDRLNRREYRLRNKLNYRTAGNTRRH